MSNIHPMIVHFTIALFSLAVLSEILGWLLVKESSKIAGFWNLMFALPAAIASVLSGRYAASIAPHNEVIHEVIEKHETFGYLVLGIIALMFAWQLYHRGKYVQKLKVLFILTGVIGFVLMSIGAFYGGELVFTHGAGVKPMMEMLAKQPHDHAQHEDHHGSTSAKVNQTIDRSKIDHRTQMSDAENEVDHHESHDHSSHDH